VLQAKSVKETAGGALPVCKEDLTEAADVAAAMPPVDECNELGTDPCIPLVSPAGYGKLPVAEEGERGPDAGAAPSYPPGRLLRLLRLSSI
jgi:hypothetical protein